MFEKEEIIITLNVEGKTIRKDIKELMTEIGYDVGRNNTKDYYSGKFLSASVEVRERL